ncbi:MAG: TRAM domain-containing protein [Smithella sp.]|nr:TRAM domain-containing protein [Syntrophaceae bacterium]MBP8666020.1 TRAM domain-containing protein [Syntrophaceae bacterium]MBP9530786.1 TRAM domain-containing protein [Syntrophaceae bacterium]MBP9650640.1 TRAM domain-containing protein [Syntrophaceae bacterium]NMC90945.1 TRAM domain-containing protein [Smithella sp.]
MAAASPYAVFQAIFGLIIGLVVALLVIRVERNIRKQSVRIIAGGVVGMIIGLLIALMIGFGLNMVIRIPQNQQVVPWIYLLLIGILGYLGLVIGSKKAEEVNFRTPDSRKLMDHRLLDTSVIIDGRIADICDTGFVDGELIVPRFVLNELQFIADSSDSMKRSRGRRGLDVLNRMQKSTAINIEIVEQDFPKIKGVDGKLVALAQKLNAKLLTNDYNLNKVAELQGVRVLNVNELANAMKPVVLPGEQMTVKIIREGKEQGQGVGYLDDGTMIVVDSAQKMINTTVDVVVTSVLQTTAGRMIFTELKEAADKKSGNA